MDIIYEELTKTLDKDTIVSRAERDCEKPFGYVLELIRDEYNVPKTEGYPIAEKICKHFGIEV